MVIWWLVYIGKNISEKITKTDITLKMSTKVKGFKWLGPSITWNSLRWFSTCLSYLNGKYQIYFSLTSCKCRIFFGLSIFLYTQLSSMWRATHHFKKVQIARRHMSNMKMCSFLLLKRGLNMHSKKCRHLTMFGNTVPEQFNRFGRLEIFSNKNLISKTFMWFLLTLVSFMWFLWNLMRVIELLLFSILV